MDISPNLLPGDESRKGVWRAGGWGWGVKIWASAKPCQVVKRLIPINTLALRN